MIKQMSFAEAVIQTKMWVFSMWGAITGSVASVAMVDKSGELLFVAVATFVGAFMGALGKWSFGKFFGEKKKRKK